MQLLACAQEIAHAVQSIEQSSLGGGPAGEFTVDYFNKNCDCRHNTEENTGYYATDCIDFSKQKFFFHATTVLSH